MDQENEEKVIQKYPQLKSDILKAGHHGSKTASSYSFLQTVAPKYAIISAGRFNRYHHPDEITIKNFQGLKLLENKDVSILEIDAPITNKITKITTIHKMSYKFYKHLKTY